MNDYCYIEFEIKLKRKPEEIVPAFIVGVILQSLISVFGEIGGQTELDLLSFDETRLKGILRVPINFALKTRVSLALISEFQGIPAIFQLSIMSYCKSYGKDHVMFVTKEDHAEKSKIELPESEPQPGLLLPTGEINWNCPCLGGMATGPCGVEFRDAFSCFHYSEAEPKGSDCYDDFKTMQDCMSQYPTVYNQNNGDGDDKEGRGIGMDLGIEIDDELQNNATHSEYADGEDDDEPTKQVETVSK